MSTRTSATLALLLLSVSPSMAQSVDEIVARHIAARGGLARLQAIDTVRMSGRMTMGPGLDVPFVLEMRRPAMMRLDVTVERSTGTQAFDGTTGWVLMPFAGITEPEPMPADVVREAQAQADFDGPLVDFRRKGHTVTLLGRQRVGDADAFGLRVELREGGTRDIFLDATTYLEIRSVGARSIRNILVESETRLGDYRPVGGVMFPHTVETGVKDTGEKERMTIEAIELNVALSPERFRMPAAQPR